MSEPNETKVFYRAITDFANLKKELADYRRSLATTKAAEAAYNAQSSKDRAAATKSATARSKALQAETVALKSSIAQASKYATAITKQTVATRASTKAIQSQNRALLTNAARLTAAAKASRDYASSQKKISGLVGPSLASVQTLEKEVLALKKTAQATKEKERAQRESARAAKEGTVAFDALTGEILETADATEKLDSSTERANTTMQKFKRNAKSVWFELGKGGESVNRTRRAMIDLENGTKRLHRGFTKLGDWRPRLVPPFIALVPIIGAVIAALNPLVALIGTLGPLTLGLASNIGSLAGAFLALPGILSGVVAGISSVIASMGGVGNVFKTYSAMQKATGATGGGGSSGPTQAERADALADAEWNLAKAQRNVTKAQENLNEARQEALKDLIDLRLEVSRASLTEERAIADLRKAQEDYWDVMADPGSTLGDKLDAAAAIKEAEADLQDVRQKNIDNQKALTEAEKRGVNGSERVLDAQENLTDALISQRDAQRSLNKEAAGGGIGGAAAVNSVNEFNNALAQLSPSARKFVLAILAMQDQWKAFRLEMQETFFSQFVNDLERLPRLVDSLAAFLRPAAAAMGQFVSKAMGMLDTPVWSRDLATIGEQNATVITALGDAGLSLATALKDIVIAAEPFTTWMVTGFAEGADNFEKFVSTSRETGSLAEWLEKVRGRLSKWWTIVKNIGSTLFNYSAAASGFGDWIADNLVEMTAGWAESAKTAREEGSPFQKWLEDIKPLLSEVNGLFGDFFAWFREESMDPENIEDAQKLLQLIRDDLGPAMGRLLDSLAATDIDEKFVTAVSSIVESIATLMEEGGAEALSTFLDVVTDFFEMLADVIDQLPPEAVSALLSVIGAIAGLAFVGKFTGVTKLLGLLITLGTGGTLAKFGTFFSKMKGLSALKFTGLLAVLGGLKNLPALGSVAGAAGGAAGVAGTAGGAAGAAGAAAGATKKPGLFTKGLGIAGGLLGAIGLTDGVQNGDSGNATLGGAGVGAIFGPIGMAIGALGGLITSAIVDMFDGVHGEWNEGWNQIFEPGNYSGVGIGDFKRWWDEELIPAFNRGWEQIVTFFSISVPNFFQGLGEQFGNGWTQITTWFDENVVQKFSNGWQQIVDFFFISVPAFFTGIGASFSNGWTQISTWFDTFFVQPIQKAWVWLQQQFQNGWNWIDTYVLAPFRNGWDQIRTGFDTVVNGLKTKWQEIRAAFADPVNFVISTVYNDGIRSFWNQINDSLNLKMALPYIKPMKYADGGVMPGYTPGRDVHRFESPTGGRLELSGGEAIMRPEWTKMVGGPKAVAEMNKKARKGQAFANGGVFNGGATQSFASGGVWEIAGDIWDKFAGLFANPVKYIAEGANKAVGAAMGGLGNSAYGSLLKGIPTALINGLGTAAQGKVKNAKRTDDGPPPPGTAGGAGMGWKAQWEIVRKAFPNIQKTSDYRPGDKWSWTHREGRAIDISPSMEAFNWLRQNFPNSQALIYSPANGRQLLNGKNHLWGEPERSMHYNHVHWAMANGGVLPNLYDNGGWLQHGQMGVNLTGKPEAVLDPMESRALKSLLSGSGLVARPAMSAMPGATIGGMSSQRVVDNSVNIERYEVNNPVPERASESLPKSIRAVAYMNSARDNS